MNHPKAEYELLVRATRPANVPLFCWLTAVALGGLCYYFEEFGHGVYRNPQGVPNYSAETLVEDYCLWSAAIAAAIGIVTSVLGLVWIWRSDGRLVGSYRLSIGLTLNLLALLAVLFAQFVRGLLSGANAA